VTAGGANGIHRRDLRLERGAILGAGIGDAGGANDAPPCPEQGDRREEEQCLALALGGHGAKDAASGADDDIEPVRHGAVRCRTSTVTSRGRGAVWAFSIPSAAVAMGQPG
jgi:hypothetical protein